MKNKAQSNFISFVFYSIVSAIIFLLVYSFFFAPEMATNAWEITKEKVEDIGETISDKLPSNPTNGDVVKEQKSKCLEEIERKIEVAKEKSFVRLITDIREYEFFDNTQDALDYLESWEYIQSEDGYGSTYMMMNNIYFPIFYNEDYSKSPTIEVIDYDYIEIALVRVESNLDGNRFGSLVPAICIDNKLEKFSI